MSNLKSIKLNRVKSEVKEWSLQTKFDCYSKIYQTKNVSLQLLWLACFILLSAFTAYFVAKNILDYYEREVVSKIEIINEKPLEFPSVTICNANPFTSPLAQSLIANMSLNNYGENIEQLSLDEMISNVYEMTKMYVNSDEFGKARRDKLEKGFRLIKCLFNNIKCNLEQDISSYFSYMYGNCVQFNHNYTMPTKQTITEGPTFGLTLVIHLDSNESLDDDGRGLKLFIHNKTYDNRITEEINLKTGHEINVAIKRTFSSKTPHPYSDCEDLNSFESSYFRILTNNNKTYRQYDCFKLCLQKMINDKCECHYTKFLKVKNNLAPCQNLTQLNCIYNQQNNFRDEELTECYKQCPLECDSTTYDSQLSSLDYPSRMVYMRLRALNESRMGNTSFEEAKESLISLKVYYSFTQYTEIREVPKTLVFDLISQIGGSLGMLLGFSIFHLIELIEVVVLVCLSFFRN